MVSTAVPEISMPSRLTVLKPVSVNVIEYVPGFRSMIRYWPVPSVTTERTFSIKAGLAASTVTPGSTAPDASRTVPVRVPCANTVEGSNVSAASHRKRFTALDMYGVLLAPTTASRRLPETNGTPPFGGGGQVLSQSKPRSPGSQLRCQTVLTVGAQKNADRVRSRLRTGRP